LLDRRARSASAVFDAAEELEIAADVAGDVGLFVAVHGEGGHPINLRRLQAGIVESSQRRLNSHP
jgi:hypothetical protein